MLVKNIYTFLTFLSLVEQYIIVIHCLFKKSNRNSMKLFLTLLLALISASTLEQTYPKLVALNEQHHFKETVPKGNYRDRKSVV